MKRPNNLTSQFEACDPEFRNYVLALEKENANLQEQVAELQVKDVSNQHKIEVLEKMQPEAEIIIQRSHETPPKTD